MLKLMLLISFIIPTVFAQDVIVKQITDFDFDCRRPVIAASGYSMMNDGEILFEGGKDSVFNIYSLKYDSSIDSFYSLELLSVPETHNRNISALTGLFVPDNISKIAAWETYGNNNSDLVISVDSGYGWTEPVTVVNSESNETNPQLGVHRGHLRLLYQKNNAICLKYLYSQITDEALFEGNDSINYNNAAYGSDYWSEYVAVEERINNGTPYIAFRMRRSGDTTWSDIKLVNNGEPAKNPGMPEAEYFGSLVYESLENGYSHVKWIDLEELENPGYIEKLSQDTTEITSDFSLLTILIITKNQTGNPGLIDPYCYKTYRNDSCFVVSSTMTPEYWTNGEYTVYTKIRESIPSVGFVGESDGGRIISYTLWEDSSNGRINIYGIKRIDRFASVYNENGPVFLLAQNYPNPFNPVTTIKYSVKERGNVSLKVYDILGKEVATLVNEDKPAGDYDVTFNGSSLASGVYIYRMTSGEYSDSKKLLLLK